MLNHTLYQIEEVSDIWADGGLRDSEGRLMFLSVYGRDGVLMQMLAAFELGAAQRGVDLPEASPFWRAWIPATADQNSGRESQGLIPADNLMLVDDFGPPLEQCAAFALARDGRIPSNRSADTPCISARQRLMAGR